MIELCLHVICMVSMGVLISNGFGDIENVMVSRGAISNGFADIEICHEMLNMSSKILCTSVFILAQGTECGPVRHSIVIPHG